MYRAVDVMPADSVNAVWYWWLCRTAKAEESVTVKPVNFPFFSAFSFLFMREYEFSIGKSFGVSMNVTG